MPDKRNVSAGKPKIDGAVYRAPIGTPLPTTATETLSSAYKAMGYISSDGLTNSNKPSTSNVKAWGGDTVMTVQTGKTDTLAFTLLEALNEDVLSAVHGSGNVRGSLYEGITVEVNADLQEEAVWVIDMILNGNTAKRILAPIAVISDMADVVYKDDAAIGYGVTLTCMPDSLGNTHYEFIKGTPTGTITLSDSTATIAAGATKTVTATTTPADANVRWESDNTDVATVTGGVITAVAAGSCTVRAWVPTTGAAAYAAVTVTGS